MTKRIFQYIDPRVSDESENTRWIAAPTKEEADALAKKKGWQACGGEIFDPDYIARNTNRTHESYIKFGCDEVI